MTRTAERKFELVRRGHIRDEVILANFRNELRTLVNPDTGALFTEDEIAQLTQKGSRFYIEADAIDLFGQAVQSRAAWTAEQTDPRRANSSHLRNHHGRIWGVAPLDATGGSGTASATAPAGSVFVGSTRLGDSSAAVARDPAGNAYQVLVSASVAQNTGSVALVLQGIDVGSDTNPIAGTKLRWSANAPLGAAPEFTVSTGFTGGFDAETDPEFVRRLERRIKRRSGSGNNAHMIEWAERSSNAVESAFVYACAFHAGSALVCILQKRGSAVGPNARIASVGTLNAAISYLVPPASPVVPARSFVLVTTANPTPTNLVLKLGLRRGVTGGWADVSPWPTYASGFTSSIATLASQTQFTITTSAPLPGGVASLTGGNAPKLMVWNAASSEWEQLKVSSVSKTGNAATVTLSQGAEKTLAVGDYISPYTDRAATIAGALQSYFDELGPGEVVGPTDARANRARRYPRPTDEYPYRSSQTAVARLEEVLGTALGDVELTSNSLTTPALPADISVGPNLITLGKLVIHPID